LIYILSNSKLQQFVVEANGLHLTSAYPPIDDISLLVLEILILLSYCVSEKKLFISIYLPANLFVFCVYIKSR